MGEKTEQPSAKKLRDARKQGQFAKSKLLSSAAVTFGGFLGFIAFADTTSAKLQAWTTKLFTGQDVEPVTALYEGIALLALAVAPALIGAFVGALLASVATAGLEVNTDAIAPKLERLNPGEGVKRLFSTQQLFEIVRGLVVAGVMAWLVWSAVEASASAAFKSVQADGGAALSVMFAVLRPTIFKALAVLLVLGLADFALAKRRHTKQLMMTKEEVKQEYKQSEGDPHHKAKRKQLHRQLAAGGQARGVQKASAVVVNPTHIAVALRYDERECEAPYLVAKGREEDALKLRKEAEQLGIPVIRDIPLARSLVQFDVGEEVPEELYQAAAAVLKVALEAKERDAAGPKGETP